MCLEDMCPSRTNMTVIDVQTVDTVRLGVPAAMGRAMAAVLHAVDPRMTGEAAGTAVAGRAPSVRVRSALAMTGASVTTTDEIAHFVDQPETSDPPVAPIGMDRAVSDHSGMRTIGDPIGHLLGGGVEMMVPMAASVVKVEKATDLEATTTIDAMIDVETTIDETMTDETVLRGRTRGPIEPSDQQASAVRAQNGGAIRETVRGQETGLGPANSVTVRIAAGVSPNATNVVTAVTIVVASQVMASGIKTSSTKVSEITTTGSMTGRGGRTRIAAGRIGRNQPTIGLCRRRIQSRNQSNQYLHLSPN